MVRDGKLLYRVECWKQQVWESWCQILLDPPLSSPLGFVHSSVLPLAAVAVLCVVIYASSASLASYPLSSCLIKIGDCPDASH
ncbi:hypothetical protein JHK85_057585 [Glycine max]|nr:hypothetical protein JHK85_057585 [Glycine max]